MHAMNFTMHMWHVVHVWWAGLVGAVYDGKVELMANIVASVALNLIWLS